LLSYYADFPRALIIRMALLASDAFFVYESAKNLSNCGKYEDGAGIYK